MKNILCERIFETCNYVIMTLLSLLFLLPFVIVLSTSLVSPTEAVARGVFILFPHTLDFSAYKTILGGKSFIYNAYGITIFRVVIGTLLNLVFTAMLAYGLSKKQLPGRNALNVFVFITMMFGGGLIPWFLVIKYVGLYNTIWALIFPGLISAWNMFIMRNFFYSIPVELEESAVIDGATAPIILLKIVIPLSTASFATIGLFYAVGHWNAWFDAVLLIQDTKKMPIQVIMRNIVINLSSQELNPDMLYGKESVPPPQTIKSAVIITSTIPILIVYPYIQKYFVKGVLIGAIKG